MNQVYLYDIFYDILQKPKNMQYQIIKEAWSLCDKWFFDELISYSRVNKAYGNSNDSIDIYLKIFDESNEPHTIFILRRGYNEEDYRLEVGYRTMDIVDHFLFIYLDIKHLNYFIEKFNLKTL